jgi:dTDP-4-dehydrorhamnose reductase
VSSETRPRILVTGASGRLGRKLVRLWRRAGQDVVGAAGSRAQAGLLTLDLRSRDAVRALLDAEHPDVIVHAAAMTDVEACERDTASAFAINAESTAWLAAHAVEHAARLVYISTDYVFDGESGPYLENAAANPLSVYGHSKLAGERAALQAPGASVVRVGILYSYNGAVDGATVVSQVTAKLRRNESIALDGRRLKYPTLTDDVARALAAIIARRGAGVFHIAGPEPVSRYEWGRAIARCFGLDERLVERDDSSERGSAQRPRDVALIDSRLGFAHTPLLSGLELVRRQMSEEPG